jgi:hypothetical protein
MKDTTVGELLNSYLTCGISFNEMINAISRLADNAIAAEAFTDTLCKTFSKMGYLEQEITEQNRPETSEKTENPNQKMDLEIFEPNIGHIDFIEFEDNPFCDGIIFTEE